MTSSLPWFLFQLKATFTLPIIGVKKNPNSPLFTQLGVITKGTIIEVSGLLGALSCVLLTFRNKRWHPFFCSLACLFSTFSFSLSPSPSTYPQILPFPPYSLLSLSLSLSLLSFYFLAVFFSFYFPFLFYISPSRFSRLFLSPFPPFPLSLFLFLFLFLFLSIFLPSFQVNVSELGLVTTGGKVVWGKYAQVTNNPENDGAINAVLLV